MEKIPSKQSTSYDKKITDIIHRIAGTLVFTSALLGFIHSANWLYVTMFVGLNLFQYGFTGFCPLELLLRNSFSSRDKA